MPSIYFGDYLELSTNEDALEAPLGYRYTEFCVKNPLGQDSPWIPFSYDFNDELLTSVMSEAAAVGRGLVASNQPGSAVAYLRKAMMFAKNLLGDDADETVTVTKEWNDAIDVAALARLRFRAGSKVRIVAGEFKGTQGTIVNLYLRHVKTYYVRLDSGGEAQVADDEVELAS